MSAYISKYTSRLIFKFLSHYNDAVKFLLLFVPPCFSPTFPIAFNNCF